MTGFGEPQLVRGAGIAGDLFHVLRVRPHLGRLYGSDASEPGKHYIAVVSHGFWQRVGGGGVDFLARKIMLNGHQHEVIGVLPPGFEYPAGAEIWLPMPANEPAWRVASVLVTLARLQPSVVPLPPSSAS